MTRQLNDGKIYVIGVSGASGSIYGIRLIKALAESGAKVMVILSRSGLKVLAHEMGMGAEEPFIDFLGRYPVAPSALGRIRVLSPDDIAASPASGSFVHDGMAVAPCSMKTLASVAAGFADNLLSRSCDVALKEKRPLVLVPRETPLNLIHLENMTRAARAGAVILPPCPSFYTFAKTLEALVDTVTARIMDHLGAGHNLVQRWGQDC